MTDELAALIRRLNAQGWLVKPPFGAYFLVEQPATQRVMAWSAADPIRGLTEFQALIDGTTRGWPLHPAWKDTMVAADVSDRQEPVFGVVGRKVGVSPTLGAPYGQSPRQATMEDAYLEIAKAFFGQQGLSAALRRLGEAVDRMTEALS